MPFALFPLEQKTPTTIPWSNITDGPANCPDGVHWIEVVFQQCVIDGLRYTSVIFGIISLVAWTSAGFPQLVKNCREGIPDVALSPWMLGFWMIGDTLNLVGAILSHQLHFQIYVSGFYVGCDVINCIQYGYFKLKHYYKQKRQAKPMESYPPINSKLPVIMMFWGMSAFGLGSLAPFSMQLHQRHSAELQRSFTGRKLLFHGHIFDSTTDIIGYSLGTTSAVLYFGSRLPQIYKNYKRKSTEGVSIVLFILALIGNGTYGASVLFQSVEVVFIIQHLPWLVGTIGIMGLDVIITAQCLMYKKEDANLPPSEITERSPLINA